MNIKEITKIFIIESPSSENVKQNIKEGLALNEILNLSNIKNTYFKVDSITSFNAKLIEISCEVKNEIKKYGAITLHFSMHGNKDGIGFTNGEFLNWEDLYIIIKDFNDYLGYIPIPNEKMLAPINLHLSVCEGFYAVALKKLGNESPYQSLVAPIVSVSWTDSIIAFATYYHSTLHKLNGGKIAVEKMNLINDFDNVFRIDLADGLRLK